MSKNAGTTTERRKHKRHRLSCGVAVQRASAKEPLKGKSIDISDGGLLLPIPIKVVPRVSERVKVLLAIPRTTPNTHMVEEISCEARVVRHQPMENDEVVGVALQFQTPLKLGLEV